MSTHSAMQLPASAPVTGLAASWTLSSERAVMFGAQSAGYLYVDRGTVWATLDGPHQGPANDWGDLVLKSGTRIHITAGQHVVLERFQPAANEAVCFSWEPEAATPALPAWRVSAAVQTLLAMSRRVAAALRRWLAPGPSWPHDLASEYESARDLAWRDLYHLRISQP